MEIVDPILLLIDLTLEYLQHDLIVICKKIPFCALYCVSVCSSAPCGVHPCVLPLCLFFFGWVRGLVVKYGGAVLIT